jgi:hypothetical protein
MEDAGCRIQDAGSDPDSRLRYPIHDARCNMQDTNTKYKFHFLYLSSLL